jgi:3-methyladenine DNA glycosylase/8-oxoguanine DNA glycosylase
VGVLGAAQAAAWFYFRKNQPVTDELTRERLRRWSDK